MAAARQPEIFRSNNFEYDTNSDFLGAGTFGIVYKCRLRDCGQQVAIKIVSAPKKLKSRQEATFLREVRILHQLTECPYVIRLLGLCLAPYAIVMEYVENGDLEDMLVLNQNQHKEIKNWSCRINMSLEIAKGMDFLHSRSPPIIHRDLKTSNVLVDGNYSCKIIDFGLSTTREISRQSGEQSNSSSKGMGTVAFTAPEVFLHKVDKKQETKIDVYSYSIILWQLKEMKRLYDEMYVAVIRANVLSNVRPNLSDDNCNENFRRLIIRCWDDQPDIRLDFKEIIAMLEGIIRQEQTFVSCSQGSHDSALSAVGEVHAGDETGDISQSVTHTDNSSIISMVPQSQSVEISNLESTFSSSAFILSNPLPIASSVSADHEEIVYRHNDIASSEKAGRKTRRFKKVKRKFVIDPAPFGNSAVVILTAQTPGEVDSENECSYFYRINGLRTQSWCAPSQHLSHTLKAANEVLTKIRREADETSTQFIEMDIWVHVGRQLITNVHYGEELRSYHIGQMISKMKYSEHGTNWTNVFKPGFQEQDWFPFCRFLEENAVLIHSTTRHDMKFTTPSHRERRFKVWIPEGQTGGTDDVDPSQQEYLEGGKKVGCGFLFFPYTKRLIAEVSMPYYPLDCRLLIQTGIIDITDQTEEEKKEDAILSQYYLEKFRVDVKGLEVPSKWLLPPKYRLIYHRRCERDYYRYRGFKLTVSREKTMHTETPENIDVHIRSSNCECLRQKNRGQNWKPEKIASFIPEMLECAKTILSKEELMSV